MIPDIRQHGKVIIRGTPEWDQRELARSIAGCFCISMGPIDLSLDEQRDEQRDMQSETIN